MRIINVDGTETERKTKLSLKQAQEIVGGYVEMYNHNGKQVLMCEDGRLFGFAINCKASDILGFLVVGNVVIGNANEKLMK